MRHTGQKTALWNLFGNFYGTPRCELNTSVLNITEKINEQSNGQNPTTIYGSTWSLQKCVRSSFLTHTCTSTKPERSCMAHLSPVVGPSLSPSLMPKSSPWAWISKGSHSSMATKQCWDCFFTPCKESVLPLAFLLPASLIPSCIWAFLPSMPDHSLVTVRISLSYFLESAVFQSI